MSMVGAAVVLEVAFGAGAGIKVGTPRCPTQSGLSFKFWLQPESEAPWRGALPLGGAIFGAAAKKSESGAAFGEEIGGFGSLQRNLGRPRRGDVGSHYASTRKVVVAERRLPEQIHFESDVMVWFCSPLVCENSHMAAAELSDFAPATFGFPRITQVLRAKQWLSLIHI